MYLRENMKLKRATQFDHRTSCFNHIQTFDTLDPRAVRNNLYSPDSRHSFLCSSAVRVHTF